MGDSAFMPDGGLPLMLARAAFVASLLSVGGSLAFRVLIAPRAVAVMAAARAIPVERALSRLTWISLSAALPSLATWAVLQAAAIASAGDLSQSLAALPPVLTDTRFGHLLLLQLGLLAATAALLAAGGGRAAAIVAACNVVLQAGHSHAMAMDGVFSLLFCMDALHLLAAAVWIGGLLPLLLVVHLGPARAGATAARWFAPLGKWAVGLLAGSGVIQAWVLIGSLAALRTTPYATVVLFKAMLFVVLLGFALLNRYWLAPELRGAEAEGARRRLAGSIAMQTMFGLLALAAASWLSGLAPGMDMQTGIAAGAHDVRRGGSLALVAGAASAPRSAVAAWLFQGQIECGTTTWPG